MRVPSRRSAGRRRVLPTLVLAVTLLGAGTLSASGDPLPEFPDHPGLPIDTDYLMATEGRGRSEIVQAKQWLRVPLIYNIAQNPPGVATSDPSCRREAFKGRSNYTSYSPAINFISKPGAPEPFGYVGPMTVRSVAFGSVPVEAQVYLVQERNEHNQPISLKGNQTSEKFCPGKGPNAGPGEVEESVINTYFRGRSHVWVKALTVDGVDLRLNGRCQTSKLFDFNLTMPNYYSLDPAVDPADDPRLSPADRGLSPAEHIMTAKGFNVLFGGLLTATIDIPPFTGCTTSTGDDVSALLTATVSGPGNKVEARSEALVGKATPEVCEWTYTCAPRLYDDVLPARED